MGAVGTGNDDAGAHVEAHAPNHAPSVDAPGQSAGYHGLAHDLRPPKVTTVHTSPKHPTVFANGLGLPNSNSDRIPDNIANEYAHGFVSPTQSVPTASPTDSPTASPTAMPTCLTLGFAYSKCTHHVPDGYPNSLPNAKRSYGLPHEHAYSFADPECPYSISH
jgi:hypothetical protein